jgi:peptide/nickel transport system substrate-binding protein
MIDNIWFGYGKPATGAMTSNFTPLGLHTATVNYPASPDVAKANAMLDAAGIEADADGVRVTAVLDLIPYGEDWRRAGEYLKQALAEIGIKLELRYEDVPTWLKRVYADYDFELNLNYFYQLPDPVIGVQRHYGTDQIRQGTPFVNSTQYSNSRVDELLSAGAIESDPAKRTEIYAEISTILGEDMPVINIFEMEFLTVYSEKLKDHTISAMGAYGSFDRAYLVE